MDYNYMKTRYRYLFSSEAAIERYLIFFYNEMLAKTNFYHWLVTRYSMTYEISCLFQEYRNTNKN